MRRGGLSKGFTLVELLTVVIIMGIMFGLVAYSVSRMLPNMQLATASQQLLGAVGQARMMAVTKSAYVKLQLKSSGMPTIQDTIYILMKSPHDTLGWSNFNPVSMMALSRGIKLTLPGGKNPCEYYFWRDGSLEGVHNSADDPQIVNTRGTIKTLHVMSATGIAVMQP